MMLKNKINWLFCISFILVGCKTEFSNPTLTNIVKPTQVTTTKTITPTLTPTVLQTSYSLPKISDNGILFDEEQSTIKEITSTPKPKNTLGPTSTPFQTSVLSPPQGDSSKYKLSLSDPERLFQIKRENYLKSESVSFEELELTAWLLDDVIDYEWKRVYSPDKYSSSLFHLLPERYGYVV